MKLHHTLVALSAALLFAACDDDNNYDSAKPEIMILSPEDDSHFHAGESFELEALIRDNEELASWKIDIHFNPDGHVHKSASTEAELEWQYSKNGNIEPGLQSFTLKQTISIPVDTKHGDYHLGVYALDKSGNETVVFQEFEVTDAGH